MKPGFAKREKPPYSSIRFEHISDKLNAFGNTWHAYVK